MNESVSFTGDLWPNKDPYEDPQESIRRRTIIRPPQILIVEDSRASADLAKAAFNYAHCETIHIHNGVQAVEVLLKKPQEIDLIVLDWKMPKLNGLQTICMADDLLNETGRFMKSNDEKIPVVLYTALTEKELCKPISSYFDIMETWHKPVPYKALKKRAKRLMNKIEMKF